MQISEQTDLISLKYSRQNQQLKQLKPSLTKYSKYFYNLKQDLIIILDNTKIYILNKQQPKIFDLGKQYLIVQLAYYAEKDLIVFLTAQGQLISYFLMIKTNFIIKKDIKKPVYFDFSYSISHIFQFFLADQTGVKLYRIQQQKKTFKQVKHLSGKYNSFLYEPLTQTLIGFPIGDCKQFHLFVFSQVKYQNWFKCNPLNFNFQNDQQLVKKVKQQKSLGFQWQNNNRQIFITNNNRKHYAKLFRINRKCQLLVFFPEEGLLKIITIQQDKQKQVNTKLPSDTIPQFNVLDDMLIFHLKVQGITFIYDLNGNVLQPLVSPAPLNSVDQNIIKNTYQSVFIGSRIIHPFGIISKWIIQLPVIFHYLKNQLQIFDFFVKRKQGKMQLLKWIRKDLFKIKQINLSKFWKILFMKYLSNIYQQSQSINLTQLYSNIFYTLSEQPLIPKQKFLNILLQCLRQGLQLKMSIPTQLQNLIFELLLEFKKYQILIYLSHNDIIKDSDQTIQRLIKQYNKTSEIILSTLALDMTYRSGSCKDMLKILMKFNKIREAKKHIKLNYQKIDVLYLIQVSKYIKNQSIFQDYLKFIKSFILVKHPTMNIIYINQAQQKVINLNNSKLKNEIIQLKTQN